MTYQMTVLYAQPESPEAFDQHYDQVHGPLAATLPGLTGYTVTRPVSDPDGNPPDQYLVAILTFADEASFQTAMGGPVGQQAVADLGNFAGAGVVILTGPTTSLV